MRIIAGLFRGRPLKNFKAKHIRPTTDRVKESIFNKLAPYLHEAKVLDLFSGTGNLTIESISRGATEVTSVENHPKSIKIIKDNLQEFGVESQVKLEVKDVMAYLKSAEGQFDVILIDPPFTKKMAHDVMTELSKSKLELEGTFIVIESSSQERIDDIYGELKLLDRKSFGDKQVSYFEKEEA